jgi:hypothetical protein
VSVHSEATCTVPRGVLVSVHSEATCTVPHGEVLQTPWPLARKRAIPTERPPLVDEI